MADTGYTTQDVAPGENLAEFLGNDAYGTKRVVAEAVANQLAGQGAINTRLSALESSASFPSIAAKTWSDLNAVVGTVAGQRGEVTGPDATNYAGAGAGKHTDPVGGGAVDNVGKYRWVAGSAAWQWLAADDVTAVTAAIADAKRTESTLKARIDYAPLTRGRNIAPGTFLDLRFANPKLRGSNPTIAIADTAVVKLPPDDPLYKLGLRYAVDWPAGALFARFVPDSTAEKAALLGKYYCMVFYSSAPDTLMPYAVGRFVGTSGDPGNTGYFNITGTVPGGGHFKRQVAPQVWAYVEYGTAPAAGVEYLETADKLQSIDWGYTSNPSSPGTRRAGGFMLAFSDTPFDESRIPLLERASRERELDPNLDVQVERKVFPNLIRYGGMDGGVRNPPLNATSAVVELTAAQQGLGELGFTHAVRQRLGGHEYIRPNGLPDLRTKYAVIAMLVHAADPADIAALANPTCWAQTQTNGLLGVTVRAGSATKQEVRPNTWLVTLEVQFPTDALPITEMWLGTVTVPATAERYLTGFWCYLSADYQPTEPILRGIKTEWTARVAARDKVAASASTGGGGGAESGITVTEISAATSDSILIAGDSLTEGAHCLRGHSWPSIVSMLTDWRIEPYGVSGNDAYDMTTRIVTNAPTYGWGPRDIKPTYVALVDIANDTNLMMTSSYRYWERDLELAVQAIKALGARPIITNEHTSAPDYAYMQMADVARRVGGEFWDIAGTARHFEYLTSTNLWSGVHPGTKRASSLASPFRKALERLERPRQGMKVFRPRTEVAPASRADLVYDDIADRARLFQEVTLGQLALNTISAPYYDDLDGTTLGFTKYASEYGVLAAGSALTFTDYALVEFVLPGLGRDIYWVQLATAGDTVTPWVLDRMAGMPAPNTRYWSFTGCDGSPAPGATYSNGTTTYTVVGMAGTRLVVSPATSSPNTAGTLNKVSGTGPATIAYTGSTAGRHPDYYANAGKPLGSWVAMPDGRIEGNVSRYMQGDKIAVLLAKAAAFALSDIKLTVGWSGVAKPAAPKPMPLRASGAELLAQPKLGTAQIGGWTVTGTVTPAAPLAGGDPPIGTTEVAAIDKDNYLSQTFVTPATRPDGYELQVRVKAQRQLPLFDSGNAFATSPIQYDSWDFATLDIFVGASGTPLDLCSRHPVLVPLGWEECEVRLWLTSSDAAAGATRRITLRGRDGRKIEIAEVSVKVV